jgi:hypothetical protein
MRECEIGLKIPRSWEDCRDGWSDAGAAGKALVVALGVLQAVKRDLDSDALVAPADEIRC